jgi:hypothetical protein
MPASVIEREFYRASPETYCSGHEKRSNTPGVLKALLSGTQQAATRRTNYDQPRYRRRVGPLSGGGGAKVIN